MLSEPLDVVPAAPAATSAISATAVSYATPAASLSPRSPLRLIGVWLWCVAGLVFAMVIVGGATRLTQSGLSIVEWNPVMGVIPPLGGADWQVAFDKYKAIPQYQRVNRGMSLDEFKTIYWWEWGHRLLGRLIGIVFLLPFLWFWRRGWVSRRLAVALAGIFALGGMQGAVGWWMVASGLTERVSVSQYRLAFHLTLAAIIYAALVWTADRTFAGAAGETINGKAAAATHEAAAAPPGVRAGAGALLVLAVFQIYLGALVAGLHAGLIYNTWPLIDGHIVPSAAGLWFDQPGWRNFFENTLTVQFDHRTVAYGLMTLALVHLANVSRRCPGGALTAGAGFVAVAVAAQIMMGIMTLIHAAPLDLALLHQAMGLVVLTAAALHAGRALSGSASTERLARVAVE